MSKTSPAFSSFSAIGSGVLVAGHAAGGGVDEHVEAALGELLALEHVGLGVLGQRHGLLVDDVDDEDLRALLHQAEDAGPRRAARADDGNPRALELEALFQRANHPGHIGVEADDLAVRADPQRVAGADARGERVHSSPGGAESPA